MKLIHIFGILMAMIFGSYVLVNFILPEPNPQSAEDKVIFGTKYSLPHLASSGYTELMEQEPANPDHYFGLIRLQNGDRDKLEELYGSYMLLARQAPSGKVANVAQLGAGLCQAAMGNHFQAIFNYNKVSEDELKYLNYAFGSSYKSLRRYSRSRVYLEHELKIPHGYHQGAARELFALMGQTQDMDGRYKLVWNADTRKLLKPEDVREIAFAKGKGWIYIGAILRMLMFQFNITGFLAALGVMLIWLTYLLKLDIFDPEKMYQVLIVLLLGMIMSFGVFILSDSRQMLLSLGDATHDDSFFYWFLDVGMVEEFVKILPLIGLILWTKWLDEPFDFILYASISALGFAFIENGLYYDGIRLNIIHARAMTAVVGHMFHSSIIAYGIVLCTYRYKKVPVWIGGVLAFFVASLSHGLYDYLLGKGIYLEELGKNVYPAFVLFFLLLILFWAKFINNALNQSPYFNYRFRLRPHKLMRYLVVALTAVLAFEYLTVGMHYGSAIANRSLIDTSINGSLMILILAFGLSRIELEKGMWRGLDWRAILPYNRTAEGRIRRISDHKEIVGSTLVLSPYPYNSQLKEYFIKAFSGRVEKQLSLRHPAKRTNESDWFEVKLDVPMGWDFALEDRLLIRFQSIDKFKRKGESLALVLAVPDATLLSVELAGREQFHFMGWIRVSQS